MQRKLLLIILLVFAVLTFTPNMAYAEIINSGVAFRETGLPPGTMWSVVCNGTHYNSTEQDIVISLPPGTYDFSVPDVPGYSPSPQSGNVTAILDPIRLTTIVFSQTVPEFVMSPFLLGALLMVLSVTVLLLARKENLRKVLS